MDQYQSSYPSTPEVPSSLRQFFENFYKISDTPEAHEKYVDCFTEDAVVIMASGKVDGSDGRSLRLLQIALCLHNREGLSQRLRAHFIWWCAFHLL